MNNHDIWYRDEHALSIYVYVYMYIYIVHIGYNTYYHIYMHAHLCIWKYEKRATKNPMNTWAARAAFRGVERAQILQCWMLIMRSNIPDASPFRETTTLPNRFAAVLLSRCSYYFQPSKEFPTELRDFSHGFSADVLVTGEDSMPRGWTSWNGTDTALCLCPQVRGPWANWANGSWDVDILWTG